jgi:outer membrane murein-binding lipoprotein Lpp
METGPLIACASLLAMVFSAVITRYSASIDRLAEAQSQLAQRMASLEAHMEQIRKDQWLV